MITAHLVASTLASLTWLLRHAPTARAEQTAAVEQLATLVGAATTVEIIAGFESLTINGTPVPIDAPGAHLLTDHLLMQGIRKVEFAVPLAAERVLGLCAVLAAYPGTFESFAEVAMAAGAGPGLSLAEASSDLTFEREAPLAPLFGDSELRGPIEQGGFIAFAEEGGLVDHSALDDVADIERLDQDRLERLSAVPSPGRHHDPFALRLATVVERGRAAGEGRDWEGLLLAALELLEIEAESATEAFGKSIRVELRRMLPQAHLCEIARLASQGGHKQDALAILRKLGADSTEVLMDMLVEAMTLGERRGYYSALTHMSEGHDVIIAHLRHQTWYVVRNAAELCGEMDLERAVPNLAQQANHEDARVRRSVAGALGKIGSPQALEPLRQLMQDPIPAVRLRAVGSLNPRRARSLVMPLVNLLGKETHAEVLRETTATLGRIGTPDAIQALVAFAQPSPRLLGIGGRPAEHKVWAVEALALAGTAARTPLQNLARDGEGAVRRAAEAALEGLVG